MYIDHSLYPDMENPPDELNSDENRAAWDFGLVPCDETLRTLSNWKSAAIKFSCPTLVAFHALCEMFGWPHPPHSVPSLIRIKTDRSDEAEERRPNTTKI
jgi:hypothetical protein